MQRRYRVVVAEPGQDGHDRSATILARALRDAGFEVIATGRSQTPDQIVATTLQEDADALGLAASGAPTTLFPLVAQKLSDQGVDDVVLFGDGVPFGDIMPGASLDDIAAWLETTLDRREAVS